MGREVRKVPANWEHPKYGRFGSDWYTPLFYGAGGRYEKRAQAWLDEANKWAAGERPDYAGSDAPVFYQDWDGAPPESEYYMLVGVPDAECTHFMLYESTSKGTPLGPAFATLEEVAEHAAEYASTFASIKTTKEEWLRMLSGDCVMTEIAPGIVAT